MPNRRKQTQKLGEDFILTCTFDVRYKDALARKRSITDKLEWTSDGLMRPLLEVELDEINEQLTALEHIPSENIDRLFKACEALGIPRIFIGQGELVGADEAKWGDWQPAIWTLKELLDGDFYGHRQNRVGFAAGCGNTDQSQVNDTDKFVPKEFVEKAWDVATRTEVSREPFEKRMVVTGRRLYS